MQFKTLVEALQHNRGDSRFVGFINGQEDEKILSFEQLYQRALGVLHVLQQKGLQKGDHVILFLNDNEKMVDVFWACQLGGIVPVPLAVGISDQHRQKVLNVAERLGKAYLYTDRKTLLKLQAVEDKQATQYPLMQNVLLSDDVGDISIPGVIADITTEDVSFVQFSSGSTGSPKGIVLKHRNLLANIEGIQANAEFTSDDISLSWMPLTHDMGLIGFHLNPIVCNYTHYIMRTDLFVRRPLYWLIAASMKKANVLCSPNFGYKHFLNAFQRKGCVIDDSKNIDLSHMRLIFNGAEPISTELCEQFTQQLQAYALPKNSMFPVYGMAEASLAVSFPPVGAAIEITTVQRNSLSIGQSVIKDSKSETGVSFVGVGKAIKNCQIRISDKDGKELADNMIGHIHIKGANVTENIMGDDGSIFFADGWLDTGDLGFMSASGLFITGRFKEILFVNGQNYYPHDIEQILQQYTGQELGKVVVIGAASKQSDLEEVLVFVLHKGGIKEFLPVVKNIKKTINEKFGIEVHHVLPITKVPKTTSGKVQRSALANEYLDGVHDNIIQELKKITEQHAGVGNDTAEVGGDETVKIIMKICKEVLTDKVFTADDSLLELGASSLALVEIHTSLDETFPDQIEITDLVDHPTVTELASFVRQKQSLTA